MEFVGIAGSAVNQSLLTAEGPALDSAQIPEAGTADFANILAQIHLRSQNLTPSYWHGFQAEQRLDSGRPWLDAEP